MITLKPEIYAAWIPKGKIICTPSVYAAIIPPSSWQVSISADTKREIGKAQAVSSDTERTVKKSETALAKTARDVCASNEVSADSRRIINASNNVSGATEREVEKANTVSADTKRELYSSAGQIEIYPAIYAAIVPPSQWQVSLSFDTARQVSTAQEASGDTKREVGKQESILLDTSRETYSPYTAVADTQRAVAITNTASADTQRLTSEDYAILQFDTSRLTAENFAVACGETCREVKKSESILIDTSRWTADGVLNTVAADISRDVGCLNTASVGLRREVIKHERIDFDTSIRVPCVLKYIVAAPAARAMAKSKAARMANATSTASSLVENFHANGIRSFAVTLGELTLSDTFQLETSQPLEIDDAVKGQLLDYDFSFLVEETSQRDLIQTVKGMYDKDVLLYSSIPIFAQSKITVSNSGNSGGSSSNNDDDVEIITYVSYYAAVIAGALRLKLHRLCDDFIPSQDFDDSEMTYRDFISALFGWTSKLPHRQINVFIRGDTLHIIQRGMEENVVDITDWTYTRPTIEKKLVRTVWQGRSKDSSGDDGDGNEPYTEIEYLPMPFNGTISFEAVSYTYSDGFLIRETNDKGVTNYFYDRILPLIADKLQPSAEDTYIASKVSTSHDRTEICETEYFYVKTYNDVFLFKEAEVKRSFKDGKTEITERVTRHVPIGNGWYGTAVYVNGEYEGSSLSQGKPGGKASRYTVDSSNIALGSKIITTHYPERESGSSRKKFRPIEHTIFPIKGVNSSDFAYFNQLTSEHFWLNRKTQETVSLEVVSRIVNGVPEITHVLDFTERIRFRGSEYFLVSNTVELTPRSLKQNVKMVRWY